MYRAYVVIYYRKPPEKEEEKTFLDQASAYFFLCDQKFQFEMINPVEFTNGRGFKKLFKVCQVVGATNYLFGDVLLTILKMNYFQTQNLEISAMTFRQAVLYMSMWIGLYYTWAAFFWIFKNVLAPKQNIIKGKACEEMFIQLNKDLDIYKLSTFSTDLNDIRIAYTAIKEHPYSQFRRVVAPKHHTIEQHCSFLEEVPITNVL